jgi:hypothetical protein
MPGDKSFVNYVDPKKHISEEFKSHEITEGEIRMAIEEFRKIELDHKDLVARLFEEAKKDTKLSKFSDVTIKKIAEMVASEDFNSRLYELGSRHGQDLSEILGVDDETLYQNSGIDARYYFDWLSAQDLTYSQSDLKINPTTGRLYAYELKDSFQEARREAMSCIEKIYQGLKK